MKSFLILFNIFLGVMLVWGVASHFKAAEKTVYTVKKRSASALPKEPVKQTPKQAETPKKEMTPDEQLAKIIDTNIFNADRCPNASTPGRNTRVELSLVGTFKIGDCVGAIIKQKGSGTNTANRMPFPFPGGPSGAAGGPAGAGGPRGAAGGPPAGGPAGAMAQGRQMGIARNNRSENINTTNTRGAARGVRGQMKTIYSNITVAAAGNQVSYKQYVRLGETLSNGYTLVEVNRDSVLLTRGSDKLELELLDASKNAPQTARTTNRRVNTGTQMLQTLQNMQRMQMFQNMQMMRMMRQNQNQNSQQAQPQSTTGNMRSTGTRARSGRR